MKYFNNEEAVSPVIGVILMVAITVILAAVIGVFVFGLAGNIQSTKTVAFVTSQSPSGNLEIVCHGGPDIGKVTGLNLSVGGNITAWDGTPVVGGVYTAEDPTGSRVILVANFNDGTSAVVVDKQY